MEEKPIGEVTHFYGKINVAVIRLDDGLKKGDRLHIRGDTTDFEQEAGSMQIEHEDVEEAKPGDDVGIKLDEKARTGDKVMKVTG